MGTPRKCPDCGTKLVPIVHGMPNEQGFLAAQEGRVILGGCDITGFDPTRGCPDCGWNYTPPDVLADYETYKRNLKWSD